MNARLARWLQGSLIVLLLLASGTVNAQAPVIKACGHPFYPPVSWVQQGQLLGVAPKVSQLLFNALGYEVELQAESNWKRCLRQVEQGQVDIVVAAYRIAERERYLHFSSQPVISDPISLFINRQHPFSFDRLEDLEGKTVGLLLGDSFGDKFDRYLRDHTRIEYVSSGLQNFGKLALGRIDFMPLGRLSGELQSQKLGFNQIVPLDPVISTEYYYLAIGHHSDLAHHLPKIDLHLTRMRQDGTLTRLIQQQSQRYLAPDQ
ncbi:substrate-binding periplasmic protein [Motiliproteus sp.]|uniref:substrate-binding periplasmic protein n=1 Tax=Motiliproteus sp. TaxID=1898955 RepID=UPI003BAB8130